MKPQFLGILAILLIIGGGLWYRNGAGKSVPLTVIASAGWDAQIEPCGCSPDQPGGLPRRATVLKQLQKPGTLMVDCGNVATSSYDPKMTRLRWLLVGMQKLGYNAINLGTAEVELGAQDVRYLHDNYPSLKFVSANVIDTKTGKLVVEPYQIVTLPKLKVGITGIASSSTGQDLQVNASGPALAGVINQLKGQVDAIVVLQDGPADKPAKIAFYDRAGTLRWQQDVPKTSDTGKVFMAQAAVSDLSHVKATAVEVPFKTTPEPQYAELVNKYKREVSQLEFDPSQWAPFSPFFGNQTKFVTDAACATCHTTAHAIWQKTDHAHAMATLQKNGDQYRPECVRCHSVGYALPSGFKSISETPRLSNVQCESCHGPGAAHVAYYQNLQQHLKVHNGTPPTYGAVDEQFCVNCHDPENDTKYHKVGFDRYWAKIKHGNEPDGYKKILAFKPGVREMLAALGK